MTPTVAAPHHGVMQPGLGRHVRLIVASVLAAVSIVASFVPALRGDEVAWAPLVPVIPLVIWCALPIHVAAVRSILSGAWTPDVLATLGIAAALAWSAKALTSDEGPQHLVPVALATVLMVAAWHVGKLAGLTQPYGSSPMWLTPLLIAIAIATLVAWWVPEGAAKASSTALSALLIAGPGALRLAAPAALLVGARRGAEIGMTTTDHDTLAAARHVDTVILDKDGTVTTGNLSVMSVDPVDPEHLRNLRWFAGALEHVSEHPIGRAIAKLSAPGRVANVVQHPGLGISGSVDRHPVRVGRPSWIGIEHTGGLGTQVGVEVDGRALGRITVADTVRPDARAGISRLRELGLDPVLVSDRPDADTTHLAEQTGIATRHAEMTVEGRLALIHSLQSQGRVVAMVGDRDRNASAMQAADVAISNTGEGPSDGIVLAEIDVRTVAGALALTQDTCAMVATTQRWAVIGMLVPLPFAAAGLIEPIYASLVSLACMVGVVLVSRRIPRVDKPPA
jgi:cation transport ATPase